MVTGERLVVVVARTVARRVVARAEQEVRAYPRAYALFYRVLTASPAVRAVVGRLKADLREDGTGVLGPAPGTWPTTAAELRRTTAVATRLGITAGDPG